MIQSRQWESAGTGRAWTPLACLTQAHLFPLPVSLLWRSRPPPPLPELHLLQQLLHQPPHCSNCYSCRTASAFLSIQSSPASLTLLQRPVYSVDGHGVRSITVVAADGFVSGLSHAFAHLGQVKFVKQILVDSRIFVYGVKLASAQVWDSNSSTAI